MQLRKHKIFFHLIYLPLLTGCFSTTNNTDSNIPSQADIEQNQQEIDEINKEIDQIEEAADELIGDSVPEGEEAYQDLSGGDCSWLAERGEFYADLAEEFTTQAESMVSGSSSQNSTYQQAEVAEERSQSFLNAYTEKCSTQ